MVTRKDVDNLLRIGVIILLVAVPGMAIEPLDWVILNDTFVPIHNNTYTIGSVERNNNFTISTTGQYVENFDSEYGLGAGEGTDIVTASEYWYGIGLWWFNILDPLYHSEFTSKVGYFNETSTSDFGQVTRQTIIYPYNTYLYKYRGHPSKNDWIELKLWNATGTGTYGCLLMTGGVTGTENGILLIQDGDYIAIDDTTPIVLESVSTNSWDTIRFTAIGTDEFNITINNNTYGVYNLYNGATWTDDILRNFIISTIGGGVSDTCELYMDDYTTSWEQTKEIRFTPSDNLEYDHPYTILDTGAGQLRIPSLEIYTKNQYGNVYADYNGNLYRGVGGGGSLTHNDLEGLQGGTTSEYYHLTSMEYDNLQIINDTFLKQTGGNITSLTVDGNLTVLGELLGGSPLRMRDVNISGNATINTGSFLIGDGRFLYNVNSTSTGDGAYNNTYENTTNWVIESNTNWLSIFNQTYHDAVQWILGNTTVWNNIYNITYHDTTQKVNNNEATYNSTYNITYHDRAIKVSTSVNCSGTDKVKTVTIDNGNITTTCEADSTGAGGGLGYALNVGCASQATQTDAQTVYWGGMYATVYSTTANNTNIFIPMSGTLTSAYIYVQCTTAGTAEAWVMNVRYDNSVDWLLRSLALSNTRRVWYNNSMNRAVTQGHYIEIKEVQPTWATNPATCKRWGVLYIT